MKNNYRKLKFSILLQTVLVTALTVLVGGFLLNYVIDGIYNDSFARNFVKIMTKLQVSEPTARSLYWKLIGDNKTFFMVVGFLLLFALFFYVALSKMTKYLDQVGEGIENILSESTEPIHLITELKPIEIRLNEIKATLKRQELESVEGEKRKNDLVLFLAHDLKTPLTSIVAYLSMLDGYLLGGESRLDMNLEAVHTGKKTNSRMDAAGVLSGKAVKIFRGTIDFQKGCAGSVGNEKEDVLLLDDTIVNQTIPLILCNEEDVEGNHGATIGKLDEELLLYLESRGISEEAVYAMMAQARIDSICHKISDEEMKKKVQEYLEGEREE